MYDRERIDRFCHEVDQLIQIGTPVDSAESISDEYSGALSVVQTLSSIDFSCESSLKQTLRNRLLAEIEPQREWSQIHKESVSMNTLFQKVSSKPALSLMILVGFFGLMFINMIWPGSVATAAQNVASFVNSLWVGEHTFISFTNPDQIIEMEDGSLMMRGEYAGENGDTSIVPNLENSTFVEFEIRKFDNLAEAQTILPFRLVQPSYLPEAYIFSYVKIFGEGDLASANLHFTGPGGDLLLSQRPVGGQSDQTVSIGLPEDYIVESVEVNDQPATWAKHVLMWEADGISYLLSSPNLSITDAIRIAESIN